MSVRVVIPIYNAFDEALVCLRSLLLHTDTAVPVFIIDDASTVGDFADYAKENGFFSNSFQFVRNQKNLGFAASVNRGFFELGDPHADVLLLNSDTVVTSNWLEKLSKAAYSADNIGTVTPFSNNGDIVSLPRTGVENPLPLNLSLDSFAELIEHAAQNTYPELPTCVGFCVYVRRKLLDTIGGMNVQEFGVGYGEENEFALRAKVAGFQNILDDSTFIYHKGAKSFGKSRFAKMEVALTRLKKRFPDYIDRVARFRNEFPHHPVITRIKFALVTRWLATKQASILHILHNGPNIDRRFPRGGTERHVAALIKEKKGGDNLAKWSLVQLGKILYLTAHLNSSDERTCDIEFLFHVEHFSYKQILQSKFFHLLHVHHLLGFDRPEMLAAIFEHGAYVLSLHDYDLICSRIQLMTTQLTGGEFDHFFGASKAENKTRRTAARELIHKAKAVFAFSHSTKVYFEQALNESLPIEIVPHGTIFTSKVCNQVSHTPSASINVLFTGHIRAHKGLELILELSRHSATKSERPITWHILGSLPENLKKSELARLKLHGNYDQESLEAQIRAIKPTLIGILSLCPETYCLTLDEAWSLGIPVITTNFGAQGERVRATGAGWILPQPTSAAFLNALEEITSNSGEYDNKLAAVKSVELRSLADEVGYYTTLYEEKVANANGNAILSATLATWDLYKPAKPSLIDKSAQATFNCFISLINRLGLRELAIAVIEKIFPAKVIAALKSYR